MVDKLIGVVVVVVVRESEQKQNSWEMISVLESAVDT